MSLINPPHNIENIELRLYLEQVADILRDVRQTGEGRLVRYRDLTNAGFFDYGGGLEFLGSGEYDPYSDYSTPLAPTGVQGKGAFESIILSWDPLDNSQRVVSHAEIYRGIVNDVDEAVFVGTSVGAVFSDVVGPSSSYYYWVRYRSWVGIYSPWHSLDGLFLETAEDPTKVLKALENRVTETQLYGDLTARIDLIDTPDTGLLAKTDQLYQITADSTIAIETQQSIIDGVSAQYTVKLDVDGHVSGFGLSSTPSEYDDKQHSMMLFNVDTFAITKPGVKQLQFAVEDGKVVMDAASIVNLTVGDAQIREVAADKLFTAEGTLATAIIGDGHISNAMIGNVIESNNYSAGSSGWRINKNGTAEFRNGYFRGNIYSSNAYVKGEIVADKLTVNQANVIDTLHLRGNAVTVGDVRTVKQVETSTSGWATVAAVTLDFRSAAPGQRTSIEAYMTSDYHVFYDHDDNEYYAKKPVWYARIVRGSKVVGEAHSQGSTIATHHDDADSGDESVLNFSLRMRIKAAEIPPAANLTYYLQVRIEESHRAYAYRGFYKNNRTLSHIGSPDPRDSIKGALLDATVDVLGYKR